MEAELTLSPMACVREHGPPLGRSMDCRYSRIGFRATYPFGSDAL